MNTFRVGVSKKVSLKRVSINPKSLNWIQSRNYQHKHHHLLHKHSHWRHNETHMNRPHHHLHNDHHIHNHNHTKVLWLLHRLRAGNRLTSPGMKVACRAGNRLTSPGMKVACQTPELCLRTWGFKFNKLLACRRPFALSVAAVTFVMSWTIYTQNMATWLPLLQNNMAHQLGTLILHWPCTQIHLSLFSVWDTYLLTSTNRLIASRG